ncbi:hypothetical protein AMD27_16120 [Acinetobacter sp. TGL-Y2]|nr:hypothetical protein AMD27_16120 [Acinetobacter sp. TGL-Y2]
MEKIEELYSSELKDLLIKNEKIIDILKMLKTFAPQAYLAAGVIRNTVWAHLHDQSFSLDQTEIDVIFYDEKDVGHVAKHIQQKLKKTFPDIKWDITNQAKVHLWYQTDTGAFIPPLTSIEHALSLWPETATAVAIRLLENNDLDMIAPFGLDDLFELKLRWNDALVSRGVFADRLASKRFLKKWPKLKWVE